MSDNKTEILCMLTAMTGYLFVEFNEFHKWICQQLERDVYTHEFAMKETFEEATKSLSPEQIADAIDLIRGTLGLCSLKEIHEENERRRMENLPKKVLLTCRPLPASECPRCKKGTLIGVIDELSTLVCRTCGKYTFEVVTPEQAQERIMAGLQRIMPNKSIIVIKPEEERNDTTDTTEG